MALAEGTQAVLSTFAPGKVLYFNFALEVQPECDCMPMADTPLVQDQGILASRDVVAVEQATLDLVNGAAPLADSLAADRGLEKGDGFWPRRLAWTAKCTSRRRRSSAWGAAVQARRRLSRRRGAASRRLREAPRSPCPGGPPPVRYGTAWRVRESERRADLETRKGRDSWAIGRTSWRSSFRCASGAGSSSSRARSTAGSAGSGTTVRLGSS